MSKQNQNSSRVDVRRRLSHEDSELLNQLILSYYPEGVNAVRKVLPQRMQHLADTNIQTRAYRLGVHVTKRNRSKINCNNAARSS